MNRIWSAAALFFLALGSPASAHVPVEGIGAIGSGLLHPILTPAHLILIVALAISLGQHPPLRLRTPLAWFAPVAAGGMLFTLNGTISGVPEPALVGIALVIGVLIASGFQPAPWVTLSLVTLSALGLGLDSAVEGQLTTAEALQTLTANWISLLVILFDIAFYVSRVPPHPWLQIAVRVAGSWIAAIAMLFLAFSLRGA